MKTFIVYMATNISNAHRYIGFTSVGLRARRAAHIGKAERGRRGSPRLAAAIRKYGRDAFVWTVVAQFETSAEAFAEEIRLISELKPEYNVAAGGESGGLGLPAWNRKPVTCLTDGRIFVSASAAAIEFGIHNVSVTDVCKGKYRSVKGRHFVWGEHLLSKEKRDRLIRDIEDAHAVRRKRVAKNKSHIGISDGRDGTGRRATGPARNARPVVCVDDGLEFPSASAAARHYNIAKSAIIELCLGKNRRVSVGGRRFVYKEFA